MLVKPFIKWVGGKTKLSKVILQEFPEEYNNYHELFVGGGSVFLKLKDKKISISDTNNTLINTYKIIKESPLELINELSKDIYVNTKEAYLKNRDNFNKDNVDMLKKCALFIYLNKCCFNGLYRENQLGKFNVPFGKMNNPIICNSELILNLNKFLKDVTITTCSFEDAKNIQEGDLVYLDPPYHKTFSNYTKDLFGEKEHIKLKEFVDNLTKKNIKVLLSNSHTEFIRNLYSSYNIISLDIIYSVGKNKDNSKELLIKNY